MSSQTLAANANVALYASMLVYTLAMLTFTWHLAQRAKNVQAPAGVARLMPAPAMTASSAVAAGAAAVASAPSRPGDRGLVPASTTASAPGTTSATGQAVTADEGAHTSRQAGSIGLMLTYLATALLVAAVLLRGLAVARPPWGNMFEFTTAAAAAVGTLFSILARRQRWQWLGLFVVAPILLVLGIAVTVLYTDAGELMPALKSYWLGIHVSVAFVSVAFFTLGFTLGILSLVGARAAAGATRSSTTDPAADPAARQPSRTEPGSLFAGVLARVRTTLPDAATLERSAYSMNMVGFILWTFTLIAGAIWAKEAWGAYWQWDPKEVWTFIIWVLYAAYMHGRATAGVNHRRTTLIAMGGYAAVIINFTLVNLMATFAGMHNYSGM